MGHIYWHNCPSAGSLNKDIFLLRDVAHSKHDGNSQGKNASSAPIQPPTPNECGLKGGKASSFKQNKKKLNDLAK